MISDGKVLSLLLDIYVKPFAASAAVLPRHMRLDIHHKCSYIKS